MSFNVEEVLPQLTPSEKASLLSGIDYWHTQAIPRLNIPSIRTSDGPNGIRGQHHFNSTPTATIPVGSALGSTWNRELLFEVGQLLDRESRAKGVHVLLGPTVNIQRIPNGGRGFESYSEDPLLSGELASAYINGYQKDGLAATIKHFVGNDQENERFSSDSVISQRALREIYLKPFEIAVKKSNPKAVMTSYNRVNGKHVSEDKTLIDSILRNEWGWSGLVMSDWTGTYSTSEAINAGLDLEMPGPPRFRGERIVHSLLAKTITYETLDERVRNVLNLVKYLENSGVPYNAPETERNTPEDIKVLRKAAGEAVVLLKNDDDILPFQKTQKTLVIGPNATAGVYSGGGSALATPYNVVNVFDAITSKIGVENTDYEIGAYNHKYLPSLKDELFFPDSENENGTIIEISNELNEKPFDIVRFRNIHYFRMNDYVHKDLKSPKYYSKLTSIFIPKHTGEYIFGIAVYGTAKLYINDELIIDNATKQTLGDSFYGLGTPEVFGKLSVTKGQKYKLRVDFGSGATSKLSVNGSFFGGGGIRFGGVLLLDDDVAISNAVTKAKSFDQVVIVTGLNQDYESEGADREDLKLPGLTNKLIESVLKVNPNTVVLIQAGTPVEMPWASKVKSLVYSSYGGNESGNGIADVLFGDVNPSGKLPLSFPVKFEDTPSYINNTTFNGKVLYGEDVYVGYRYYEKVLRDVLFEFGHGLSYTNFRLDNLVVRSDSELNISLSIKNAGKVDGSAVIQVYISPISKELQRFRPIKELKDFSKISLKAGESKKIEFNLNIFDSTSYYNEELDKWVSEKGDYQIIIGQSSNDKKPLTSEFKIV